MPAEMCEVARPRPRAGRVGLARRRRSRRRFPEDLLIEAGLLQPRAEGKGAYDRFRDRLLFVVRGRARAAGRLRRPRALARGRAQVPELARVAGLLEEAAALRPLRGARGDPPARPRRPRRGLLRPPRARARRRRGDRRLDGHRADAGAGGEAAPPLPARRRLLRRRLRRPQRHARRPAAPARAGLPGRGSRGCPRARTRTTCSQREGPEALARAHRGGARLPDLASRGPPPAASRASRRPRSGSGSARSSRSSTPSPTGSSATRSTASSPGPFRAPRSALGSRQGEPRGAEVRVLVAVGTPGNAAVLSAVEAPAVEKRLLRVLTAGGEHNSLILRTLKDEFLTRPEGQEGRCGASGRPCRLRNLLIFKAKSQTLRRKSGRFSLVSRWMNLPSRPRRASISSSRTSKQTTWSGRARRSSRPSSGRRASGVELDELHAAKAGQSTRRSRAV